jgi:hypothetical protein
VTEGPDPKANDAIVAKRERRQTQQKRWREGNPKTAWAVYAADSSRRRARKKGVPHNIGFKDILEILPDVCPVLNLPLSFSKNLVTKAESPSLDRLVPEKGYVKGNIAVISHRANSIKNAASSSEVRSVCEWMEKKGI